MRVGGLVVKYVFLTDTQKAGFSTIRRCRAVTRQARQGCGRQNVEMPGDPFLTQRREVAKTPGNHFFFALLSLGVFALFIAAKGFPSPYLLVDRAGRGRHSHGMHVGDAVTIDEVVFAQAGDLELPGARLLEGLNPRVDSRAKKLVAGGPIPAAARTVVQAVPVSMFVGGQSWRGPADKMWACSEPTLFP
jgi:hypothetical protein